MGVRLIILLFVLPIFATTGKYPSPYITKASDSYYALTVDISQQLNKRMDSLEYNDSVYVNKFKSQELINKLIATSFIILFLSICIQIIILYLYCRYKFKRLHEDIIPHLN